jgi:hypothetical protein
VCLCEKHRNGDAIRIPNVGSGAVEKGCLLDI